MKITLLFFLFLCSFSIYSQNNKLSLNNEQRKTNNRKIVACIAFYNLENFFDTIKHEEGAHEDFSPQGKNKWNSEKYNNKIKNISKVISQLGNEMVKGGPVIMGLAEVENKEILEDLVNTEALKHGNYGKIHFKSPDRRGIDVAMIYQKKHFLVLKSKPVNFTHNSLLPTPNSYRTRDILVVTGLLDNEKINLIINHWHSRVGGEKPSEYMRIASAKLCRKIVDSLNKIDSNSRIIIMGDFNDNPDNQSITKNLNVKHNRKELKNNDLFNTMWKYYKKGLGTIAYRDSWNMFDQFIISNSLLNPDNSSFIFMKSYIFNKKFLYQEEGKYAGYIKRTYAGSRYMGGYSDHLPVYMFLTK